MYIAAMGTEADHEVIPRLAVAINPKRASVAIRPSTSTGVAITDFASDPLAKIILALSN